MTDINIKNGLIAKIHVAKKQLAMADDSYRAMLERVTGKTSSSAMTERQLEDVLKEFQRLGFKPTGGRAGTRKQADTAQAGMIRALWLDLYHLGVVTSPEEPLQAVQAYHKHFWLAPYRQLPDQVAIKVFSLAVNMYPKQAHILLQRAVRACAAPLTEDGILGPQSIAAVNSIYQPAMLAALRSEAAGFYRSLVAQDKKFQPFINGWLNRAYY